MMEIRFRAWEPKKRRWLEVQALWFLPTPTLKTWIRFRGEKVNYEPTLDEVVLEQFTGLKDKNGNDIYEGDKVCHISLNQNAYGVVVWATDWLAFQWIGDSGRRLLLSAFPVLSLEVIGNIHEE